MTLFLLITVHVSFFLRRLVSEIGSNLLWVQDASGNLVGTLKAFLLLFPLYRYNVEPPGLIKLEKEIEQEERAPQPPPSPVSTARPHPPSPSALPAPAPAPAKTGPSKKSTGKLLDEAVRQRTSPARAFGVGRKPL